MHLKTYITWPLMYTEHVRTSVNRKQIVIPAVGQSVTDKTTNEKLQ